MSKFINRTSCRFVQECSLLFLACFVFTGCAKNSEDSSEIQSGNQIQLVSPPSEGANLSILQNKSSEIVTNENPVSGESGSSTLDDDISLPDELPSEGPPPEPQTESKSNGNELLKKAMARLDQKREINAEKKQEDAEARVRALSVSRERTARELIAGMIDIPGRQFKMGQNEVSQEQWEGIMGNNPSKFRYADHPVESVSWDEVNAFIKTVNALDSVRSSGLVFRLPSPDEWEFACRAGSTGDFGLLANGREGTVKEMAWYISNTGNGDSTKPVGTSTPNAWGLYDMHGNVKEWTSALSPWDDATVCGGCYAYYDYDCTARSRNINTSRGTKFPTIGFRLCADPQ